MISYQYKLYIKKQIKVNNTKRLKIIYLKNNFETIIKNLKNKIIKL